MIFGLAAYKYILGKNLIPNLLNINIHVSSVVHKTSTNPPEPDDSLLRHLSSVGIEESLQ